MIVAQSQPQILGGLTKSGDQMNHPISWAIFDDVSRSRLALFWPAIGASGQPNVRQAPMVVKPAAVALGPAAAPALSIHVAGRTRQLVVNSQFPRCHL